jgi:virulence-associated protein VagC
MSKASLVRNGFETRVLVCESCGNKIIHPQDEQEYREFLNLKNKVFKVKLRLVGNSYAVSIPKEIVQFMHEQEKIFNDLVKLTFEDAKKLKLMFE